MKKDIPIPGVYFKFFRMAFPQQSSFTLNKLEYFEKGGVNVMAFQDIYPDGHQGGVAVIMHGSVLLPMVISASMRPGPVAADTKTAGRLVDPATGSITVSLPIPTGKKRGFNP
jgi:hypothetical protein